MLEVLLLMASIVFMWWMIPAVAGVLVYALYLGIVLAVILILAKLGLRIAGWFIRLALIFWILDIAFGLIGIIL